MTVVVDLLLSSSGIVIVLLVCVFWLWRRPASRAGRRILTGLIILYALASLWPVAAVVGLPLTRGYRAVTSADVSSGKSVIVLLGAGHQIVRGWDGTPLPVNNATALLRIHEAARVFGMSGDGWIISSGGATERSVWPESVVMRDVLVGLGVPASRILLETGSLNTRDEAVMVAGMLPSLQADRVILVTSPIHMRRSMGAFQTAGVTAIPAVSRDLQWQSEWQNWILPGAPAFNRSTALMHEYLGIASYAARGWFR